MEKSELGKKILELRSQGLNYREIIEKLGCSKSTVSYYCGEGQKEKNYKRNLKNKKLAHPFQKKFEHFIYRKKNENIRNIDSSDYKKFLKYKVSSFCRDRNTQEMKMQFTLEDVINKIGINPVCYLTGTPIDITKTKSYQFDHIIPVSRGGDNSLENLQICLTDVNQSKKSMTPDEFIELCRAVVAHADKK